MDDGNSITTRLLTLLNVSATKIGKRKRIEQDFVHSEKLNKRKSTEPNKSALEEKENDASKEEGTVPATNGEDVEMEDEAQDTDLNGSFQSQCF
jgi:U3 small nucleolar RNA-associated protein 25